MKKFLLIFILIIAIPSRLIAFPVEEYLPEKDEMRARKLFLQIKCPVCQGQVIENSDTEISYQLRQLVRKKIIEGKSDEEIKSYIINKFGLEAVNSTPLNANTFFLWLAPLIFVIFSLFLIWKSEKNIH